MQNPESPTTPDNETIDTRATIAPARGTFGCLGRSPTEQPRGFGSVGAIAHATHGEQEHHRSGHRRATLALMLANHPFARSRSVTASAKGEAAKCDARESGFSWWSQRRLLQDGEIERPSVEHVATTKHTTKQIYARGKQTSVSMHKFVCGYFYAEAATNTFRP